MLSLADLAATSAAVGADPARSVKVAELATLMRRAAPAEAPVLAGLLAGSPRQGRVGIGWAGLSAAASAPPAAEATLSVLDLDRALDELAAAGGSGSAAARTGILRRLFEAATAPEQALLRRLLSGELHQGASEGLVVDALAAAGGVPATLVRRGLMMSGELSATAVAALAGSPAAARDALSALTLRVGVPVRPMLASPAEDTAGALATIGGPASVEYKLDGARIQVHRDGADVGVFTRTLHDITGRVPEIVAAARALPVTSVVLDGETLLLAEDGRPRSFQDTMARFGTSGAPGIRILRPWFFDCLHLDGEDLLDTPLTRRREALTQTVGDLAMPALSTEDPAAARSFFDRALAERHEGVVVKDLASVYAAGRRGKSWLKVKPVATLDLIVIAAEWGHGRRRGSLSNLHLGARDPAGGPPVMVGKTFKGLTDDLLAWQTRELGARTITDDGWVATVRPELVVEIELDGAQVSPRYPGRVALRFARVLRYRPDKPAAEADSLDAVRALLPVTGETGGG